MQQESEEEHLKDKEYLKDMIKRIGIDLIVVGGSNLEARILKNVLTQASEELNNLNQQDEDSTTLE